MNINVNESILNMVQQANRVIITKLAPYNPKRKQSNVVFADVRDRNEINAIVNSLSVDIDTFTGYWMTSPYVHINFMQNKLLINSFGLIAGDALRSDKWDKDYFLRNKNDLLNWLNNQGIELKY